MKLKPEGWICQVPPFGWLLAKLTVAWVSPDAAGIIAARQAARQEGELEEAQRRAA